MYQISEYRIHKASHLACPQVGHSEQPMARVCIDPRCPQRSLICQTCQQLFHKEHQTVPLKDFWIMLNNIQVERNQHISSMHQQIRKLEKVKISYCQDVIKLKKDIIQTLNELEVKTSTRFDLLQNEINKHQGKFLQGLPPKLKSYDFGDDPAQIIKHFKDALRVFNKGKAQEDKIFAAVNQSVHDSLIQFEKMKKMLLQANKLLKEASKTIDLITSDKSFFPYIEHQSVSLQNECSSYKTLEQTSDWSKHRHQDITVINNTVIRKNILSQMPVGIITNWNLNEGSSMKRSYKYRIIRITGFMYLGICLQKQFKINKCKYGSWNGVYVVVSSQSNEFRTSSFTKHQTYPMHNGEILAVEYDRIFCKLYFNRNGRDVIIMDIEPAPIHDSYHPCVFLSNIDDSVELIR